MTNVVTSTSAISQSELYAIRQQYVNVDRGGSGAGDSPAPQPNNLRTNEGPSRPSIDIGPLDLGPSPNAADAVHSPQAGDAANTDSGAAGQGTSGQGNASPSLNLAAPANAAPQDSLAAPQSGSAPGGGKFYNPNGSQVSALKFADQAFAAGGAPGPATPKKFYGQGTEVVVGAGHGAAVVAPSKVPAPKQHYVPAEKGGEPRQHDKVSHSDTDQSSGRSGDQPGTLFERGQKIAAAMSIKPTSIIEVAAYGSSTATTAELAIVVTPTDVTA